MTDLSDRLPENSDWEYLWRADDINDNGVIVGLGKFGSAFHAFALVADSDGDGLLDDWEINGLDVDHDGVIDLDLPAMGANPMHKDLFVEVDAMVDRAPSPMPPPMRVVVQGLNTNTSIDLVIDAFLDVPNDLVDNPDGLDGIKLHVILDETDVPRQPWPNWASGFSGVKAEHLGTPAERASPNWLNIREAKRRVFRYCVFGDTHSGSTSSGAAESVPGNDFSVTLGGWPVTGGTIIQQAGTFMHELGHTLGLEHGGQDRSTRFNYKPNYHSVMNYIWQTPWPGFSASWVLDFSREQWPALDENGVDEAAGIGGHFGHRVPVRRFGLAPNPPARLVNAWGPVDWNQDGDTDDTAVSLNLNFWRDTNGDGNIDALDATASVEVLIGHNDWVNLVYIETGADAFDEGVRSDQPVDDEMTLEIFQDLNRIGCAPGDLNCDGHADLADYAALQRCFSGAKTLQQQAACFDFGFGGTVVDLETYRVLAPCVAGPDVPVDPSCGQ